MTASPDWATWSLESSKVVPAAIISQHRVVHGANGNSLNGGASLFKRTALDEVHDTEWHDFDEVNIDGEEMQVDVSVPQGLDAVDIEELFKESKDTRKGSDSSVQDRDLSEIGQFHFDPLSLVESRALQRALKLSKYIPPTAQEVEEEKQRYLALKVTNGRRVGSTINEETGKRIYNVANRGTGLLMKENNEAKDVFKAMCKSMLPKRHFDWIMAQLTFHNCNMIGFDDIPSSRTLLQEEAKESIKNESMDMYNLANVTRLLAEASKVDTSVFDVIDPTKSARQRGLPMISVKNKMMAQSKAVFDALKELYPALFQQDIIPESKPIVESPV